MHGDLAGIWGEEWLTRYDIARIHGVFVLDKAEAIHELNLRDLAGAMGVEVVLNIGLGSCKHTVRSATPEVQAKPAPSQPAPWDPADPPANANEQVAQGTREGSRSGHQ